MSIESRLLGAKNVKVRNDVWFVLDSARPPHRLGQFAPGGAFRHGEELFRAP